MALRLRYLGSFLILLVLPGTVRAPNTGKPVPKVQETEEWDDYVIGRDELPTLIVELKGKRLVCVVQKKEELPPKRSLAIARKQNKSESESPAGHRFSIGGGCVIQ